jgi:hypothetical protein
MNRFNLLAAIALIGAAALLPGCGIPNPGTVRQLGDVNYDTSLDTAKQVFSQYYSIESVDPDKGVITSSPKVQEGPSGQIFARQTRVREIATMRLTRTFSNDKGRTQRPGAPLAGGAARQYEQTGVVAQVSVEVQKIGTDAIRQATLTGENYSDLPDKSPAQGEAATTYEQNQTWFFDHYNKGEEGKILADLYTALHSAGTTTTAPAATTSPATAPHVDRLTPL